MKQGQTRLWSACAIIVASLGMSGILASGCGDDDDNTTAAGTAGSAGAGGKDGGTAGSAGKAGSGGSKEAGPGRLDAPTDATPNQCRALFDAGNACTTGCFCDTCPAGLVNCIADPDCSVILACVQRTGCTDTPSCSSSCATEIGAHMPGVGLLVTLTGCLTTCAGASCEAGPPEAGPPEAGPPDVRPDNPPTIDVRPDTLPDISSDQTPTVDVTPDTTPTNDVVPDTTPTNDVMPDTTPTNDVMPDTTPTNDAMPDTTPTNDAAPDAVPGDANDDSTG